MSSQRINVFADGRPQDVNPAWHKYPSVFAFVEDQLHLPERCEVLGKLIVDFPFLELAPQVRALPFFKNSCYVVEYPQEGDGLVSELQPRNI
jgi:hypothetical protein